jgi:hypothetical protein
MTWWRLTIQSFFDGLPKTSNCYCRPGRAWGLPCRAGIVCSNTTIQWGKNVMQIRCEGCGQLVPGYDVISYGSMDRGYKELCGCCFNSEVVKLNELHDCESEIHEAHLHYPLERPAEIPDFRG